MNLATFTSCILSSVSDSPEPKLIWEIEQSAEYQDEFILIEKKVLNHIYEAYLYITSGTSLYSVWLASKNENDKIVGWQVLSYPLAKRIFPRLIDHRKEYREVNI